MLLLAAAASAAFLVAADPEAGQPSGETAPTTAAPEAGADRIASVDDLLRALEKAGGDVRTLKADVRLTKQFDEILGGGDQIRTGTLYFATDPPVPGAPTATPKRRFQVDFRTLEVNGARRQDDQTFVFNDGWLVEKYPGEKQMFKRQVVAPGETLDPLAIGEGPFPVPIGQQRERILQRYEATMPPAEDAFPAVPGHPLPDWLDETHQLRLVPRKGTEEEKDYREVRIWYRAADLLPRMARTVGVDGTVTEVFLTGMVVNQPVPEGVFDTEAPAADWLVQTSAYRRRTPGE